MQNNIMMMRMSHPHDDHHNHRLLQPKEMLQLDERQSFPIRCIEFPTPRARIRTMRHFSSSSTGTTTSAPSLVASTFCNYEESDTPHDNHEEEEEDTCSSLDTNYTDHRHYNDMIQQQHQMLLLHHHQQRAAVAAEASSGRKRRSITTAMRGLETGQGGGIVASSSSKPQSQSPSSSTIAVKDVSRQELDAMKRMVHDMMRNPDLLHTSPLYTRSVTSMANYYQPISTSAATTQASSFRRGAAVTTKTTTSTTAATTPTTTSMPVSVPTRAPFPRRPSANCNDASDLATTALFASSILTLPATTSSAFVSSDALAAAATTTKNEDAIASAFTPSTPNNNNYDKPSRNFSLDLCHECSNSTSMLLESDMRRDEIRRRNSASGYCDSDYYNLTMSAPQPMQRTQRVVGGGGGRGEEVHQLVVLQQMQQQQQQELQWRGCPLPLSQQTQQGQQRQHPLAQEQQQQQQLPLRPQEGEEELVQHNHLSVLSIAASPTDDMEVFNTEEKMDGEETKNENNLYNNDNNNNNNNNSNNNSKNRFMALFPPMPFVPPERGRGGSGGKN